MRRLDALFGKLDAVLDDAARRGYRARPRFGLREAILFHIRLDFWWRYSRAVLAIPPEARMILDVGSAGDSLEYFMRFDGKRVVALDISPEMFRRRTKAEPVAGDGTRLPFRDASFDVVLAVDTLEHVPEKLRPAFLEECKRVARQRVVIHAPGQSRDGTFRGRDDDIALQAYHVAKFGALDSFTKEHIEAGHPGIEELRQAFPGARIEGSQNSEVWMTFMKLARTRVARNFLGIAYWLAWSKRENSPPYHSFLLAWDKARPDGTERGDRT